MINLIATSKDMEVTSNNLSNHNNIKKQGNKDFLRMLESHKSNQEEKDDIAINKEKPTNEFKVQEKESKNTILEERPIKEEDKKVDVEIDDELLLIIQSLYDLITQLNFDPEKMEDINLETLKLEIEALTNKLGELLEANEQSINEESIIDMFDTFESLVSSMSDDIKRLTYEHKEKPTELPVEEILTQLDAMKNKVKLGTDNHAQLMDEDNLSSKGDEMPNNQNVIPDEKTEFEEVVNVDADPIGKDGQTSEIITEDVEEVQVEEAQVEDSDLNNPLYEVDDRVVTKDGVDLQDKNIQNLDKNQVIEQIIDKAKVIIDDNKQEIRIKLKPEILGDLILKMEVEKGAVLAKVLVDNYRTKEIIEANLYQFKEEMKENGLEIKTFEVFVGSNEDFERENNKEFNFNKKSTKLKIKNKGFEEVKIYDENTADNLQTIYGEGQLNLFA